MSASYQLGANPAIDIPRMLVGDTDLTDPIFQDEEIQTITTVVGSVFQSAQRYSGTIGASTLPSGSVSYLRVAAMMCDALASVKSRLDLTSLQDAKADFHGSADQLRKQAAIWRKIDDESGAFAIIEQVRTTFDYESRCWKQLQRQSSL